MPIEYEIDHDRRIVRARGRGVMTDQDVFGYQREVWSRPDLAGYDELMDMTDVQRIELPSADRVRQLANLSAEMDMPASSARFAIVAPQDLAYGLGRMFASHRDANQQSTKQVGVFRTMEQALEWLQARE